MTDQPTNDVTANADFVFLVVKQKDGRYALANMESGLRQPSLEEVLQALFMLQSDLQRQQTVMAVVQTFQQFSGQGANNNMPTVKPQEKFVKRTPKKVEAA